MVEVNGVVHEQRRPFIPTKRMNDYDLKQWHRDLKQCPSPHRKVPIPDLSRYPELKANADRAMNEENRKLLTNLAKYIDILLVGK